MNRRREREENRTRLAMLKIVLIALTPVLVVALTLLILRNSPNLQNLVITTDAEGFRVELDKDGRVDLAALLQEVGEDGYDREALLAWLRQNWHLHPIDRVELVDALIEQCPPHEAGDLASYQAHLEKCDAQPVIGRLRELSIERLAPFQQPSLRVRIGTPSEHPPRDGTAYTCFDGKLENKRVRLLVEETARHVDLVVRGAYECAVGLTYPDLQINELTATRLFDRPTRRIETAVAVVL